MILATKFMHLTSLAAAGTAGAAVTVTLPEHASPFTSIAIAAACSGSASAIFAFIIMNNEKKPGTALRRLGRHLVAFILGSVFGIFMGPSIASSSPFDGLAGVYIGGVVGFGVIGFLTSPKTIKSLGEWLVEKITGKNGDNDG